jgi:small subunit ribosomal protein S2
MRDMLEAGAHFGHQTSRRNPKMTPFIYGAKNGVHIINLQRTARQLRDALHYVSRLGQKGEQILFVGTKRQAQDVIFQEASRSGQPYVTHRWLGGMLTNFRTINQSLDRMKTIEKQLEVGNVERLTKKEVIRLERALAKLTRTCGGLRDMNKLPAAVFIVDTVKEHIALAEARKLGLKVVAVADTNANPDLIDYPIPANDDAIRSIRLFASAIADAYLEGAALHKDSMMREYGSGSAAKDEAAAGVDVIVRKAESESTEQAEAPAAEAPAPEAPAPEADAAAE